MNSEQFQFDENASAQDGEYISDKLGDFNAVFTGGEQVKALNIAIRDSGRNIVGGVKAGTCFGWLYISDIWLEEHCRGMGLGSRLMSTMETEAIQRGCTSAWLTTFSFQAKPFYEKHGYQVFSTLSHYPNCESLWFLKKELSESKENE